MKDKADRALRVLLVVSTALALIAQYYMARKRSFVWDGVLIYALAMLFFTQAIAQIEGARMRLAAVPGVSLWQQLWLVLGRSRLRLGTLFASLALSLHVTMSASSRPGDRPFWDLLILWIASILLVLASFVNWRTLGRRLAATWQRLQANGPEAALVAALVLATFLLRAIKLETIPYIILGDEAAMGLEAIGVLEGRIHNPFSTGWFSNPMLYFFIQAFFINWLGRTATALRLFSAIVSAGTVLLLYAFARSYFGRRVAILSAILFCTYHYAIHFGRIGINNTLDPLLALGVFYFINRGLDTHKLPHFVAAGVFTGLTLYFHAGARLVPITLVVFWVYRVLRERDLLRGNLTQLVVFALVTLVVALPMLTYLVAHYSEAVAPYTRKGIFPSGWVDYQVKTSGRSVASILADQFLKAVLAYNFSHDPSVFYQPRMPLLQFMPSVFFVFGMAYAVTQWRKPPYFLLVLWYLMVITFGAALLENPPASYRILLSIPPVVMCVAIGISKFATLAQRAFRQSQSAATAIALVLVLASSYQSLHFYFSQYSPGHYFADINTEIGNTLGKYMKALGPQYRCYFLGAPRMYWSYPAIEFFSAKASGMDVTKPITSDVSFVAPGSTPVFVILPERINELQVIRRFYPSGQLREFRTEKGQVLFVAYEVDT